MPVFKTRPLLIRLWRLALLVVAILVIRESAQRHALEETTAALKPERLRDFFPDAADLGEAMPTSGWRPVYDASHKLLGYVTTTAPESDSIIGYSGPTHSLMVFNTQGVLTGIRVLKSYDTSDHVAEVIADREFFKQFQDSKPGVPMKTPIHTVTGATLTSAAIAQGVLAKLGQSAGTSLRFPEEISLAEIKTLIPDTTLIKPSKQHAGGFEVMDEQGKAIGLAVRTSPITDTLIGYKGPTDTLMLLDAKGRVLKKIALRKSYDTKRYVAYVTGDEYFLNLFNDRSLEELADLDFEKAKVEGVSGATETSWSVAEGLKLRAKNLLEQSPTGWLRQIHWRWQDWGHLAVILSALLMAFTKLRGRSWVRHAHHVLLVLYGGFIAGELLSQALLTGWAAHGTPWRSAPGLLLLAAVALLGPIFTSKQLYCHHTCPHGALQQLVARRIRWQWKTPAWLERKLTLFPFFLLGFIFLSVIFGWAVNLNSLEPFDAYFFRIAGWASIVIAIIGVIASLFTPLAYCKYGCPTGAVFKLIRFTGDADRIGGRDWIAAACLILAALV